MISITEQIIPFKQVGDYAPTARGRVHPSTARRWANGCRAADGSTIKLETIRVGASTMTSVEALQRFFDRLTGTPDPVRRDSVKQELSAPRRSNTVKEELAAWGLTRPAQ